MIAVDANGTLYVPDTGNSCIRKISPSGVVTLFAGQPGVRGLTDGTGTQTLFRYPEGITLDSKGSIYVTDSGNNVVRRITQEGIVTTLGGVFQTPSLNRPTGIVINSKGHIYVADTMNHCVKEIFENGTATIITGSTRGYIDSIDTLSQFYYPTSLSLDLSGNILVADQYNNLIRKIEFGKQNELLLASGIVPQDQIQESFNYADIAVPLGIAPQNKVIQAQALGVSRSSETAGNLGPTLSRAAGPQPPPIQGHQRGSR
jgi:sugar lactone lactonase YvrE